jgi:cyclophilin family peptidyl-prolyl cis-trans isomerase|tara:strand:+ start:2347 stop:2910 length:564 start_codon:yes stop_codon:yes gene_type:complete
MNKYLIRIILIFIFIILNNANAKENIMILKLKNGDVKIELFEDVAPKHVERIKKLANDGLYNNVVFHRVIDGFMAQTGDVKFGNSSSKDFDLRRAGMGGSDLPDLPSEFNDLPHEKGTLSMARSSDPNSANSQFFICFEPAPFLDRNYTVFGKVIEGMEHVDKIKRGDSNNNGAVTDPDKIISFKSL